MADEQSQAPFLTLPPGGAAPDRTWWLRANDGVRLRAAHWHCDNAKALAVLLSGRTEFLEKMAVPAAALKARGYEVVTVDWRGQGLSDRLVKPDEKGHVANFDDYQRDLDALLESALVEQNTLPQLLMAHSMGGAIATRAMLRPEVAERFKAIALSAPMYGIAMSAPMRVAAWLTLKIGKLLGKNEAWPPFGNPAETYVLTNPAKNMLTHDQPIWDWLVATAHAHPELNLGLPTLGWFEQANREMARLSKAPPFTQPALCLLGSDEQIVEPGAVRRTSRHLGLHLVEISGARHEHLVEAPEYREQAWSAIDRFLAANGLPSA